jgi:hypothetical protein
MWLYLAAKLSHVGVDVDWLACPLHHPMAYSHQTREHSLLQGVVLSRHCSGRCHLSGDVKLPGLEFCGELTAWVPILPCFTWSILFLAGYVYLMSEQSWRLGVYL